MKDISLKDLLEAGCHFGHKVSRWHPKAASFIYQTKDGIHIIDLAKTRDNLKKAGEFVKSLGEEGKILLFVATKRQAKGVVSEAARRVHIPYLTSRWVGGFATNWDEVKKNIDKVNDMRKDRDEGVWKQFPKHEQVKLDKDLRKLEKAYGGVVELVALPDAMFLIDIKTEVIALREASRRGIPVVAVVDTNTDPNLVDFPVPANDDAVGSIKYLTDYIADAYGEGRDLREKKESKKVPMSNVKEQKENEKVEKVEEVGKVEKAPSVAKAMAGKAEKPRKRGRPKKTS